jgi:hypothetical protein
LAATAGCNSRDPVPTKLLRTDEEHVDIDVVSRLREQGFERSELMNTLGYFTEVFGPRLTGSPNLKAAQEWAAKKLTEWGLENAHLEAWGPFGRGWTLEEFTANAVEPHFFRLIAYPRAWSPSTSGSVRGEVVYLDARTEVDLEKYKGKLNGAIVMISAPRDVNVFVDAPGKRHSQQSLLALAKGDLTHPVSVQLTPEQRADDEFRWQMRIKKYQLCQTENAAIILEQSDHGNGGTVAAQSAAYVHLQGIPYAKRPKPWDTDAPPMIPQVDVAVEDYNRLVRMIERGIQPKVDLNIVSKFHDDDLMGYNVVAEIPGTDLKDEIVMLGAHLDSMHCGTGATDNAAGSAACMEAVRILREIGLSPRRTIRIGLWSGEEQLYLGSRAYVAQHFASWNDTPDTRDGNGRSKAGNGQQRRPVTAPELELKPDHSNFSVYFDLDYGTGKIRGVKFRDNVAAQPILRSWLEPFKEDGAETLSLSGGGSDDVSFDAVGLPGISFIQDPIEYGTLTHHTNMDLYDRIVADDLKQAAVILASFVYHSAMRDEKFPRKRLPTSPIIGF